MPRGQPFTELCRQLAELSRPPAADLHAHTTASDGEYTPSQLAMLARQARLTAVAVTDHDTLAGVGEAVEAAGSAVAVVPGVECSAALDGREFHILGLFVRPERELTDALADVCERRRERFRAYLSRLAADGVTFPEGYVEATTQGVVSVGRRHLAGLLVRAGHASSRFEAFGRFLIPLAAEVPPTHLTPADEVIRRIRSAGGVASLAHPPEDVDEATLGRLRGYGMQAVEVNFPASTPGRTNRLRQIARRLGLAVTGGSDCHGPGGRAVGSCGVTRVELRALSELAGRSGPPVRAGAGEAGGSK